ncbi:long-chain fatty acid transporter [Caulobacter vibrioides]|nr:long-chain fatty acid transporter [Caulobacter vibrioides]
MALSRKVLAAGAALAALAAASQASASGFYLQEQSARGAGRAYSGEVADSGAASLWWNPAAIAGVEHAEVYGGLHAVLVNSKVTDKGSTITRPVPVTTGVGGVGTATDVINDGVVPNFAGAWRLNDKIVLGVSMAAPYNFTTEYEANSWARYDALKSRLTTADLQATLAYRVNDKLDLGVGVSGVYADAELTNALPNASPLQADGRQELTGDGWGYGWTVGAQYHATPALTFGASYRSKTEHTLKGDVAVSGILAPLPTSANRTIAGEATITTPWMATVGARWAVTPKTTLNAQVTRVGWSEFDAIRVTFAGGGSVSEQDYKDITTIALGVDHQLSQRLTLRAGVQKDPTPTPDDARTARVPDGDRMLYAVGATWAAKPNLNLDIAATYISFDDSEIHRTDTTATSSVLNLRGEATGHAAVLSTGVRWTF